MPLPQKIEVLIVGAGPTGLMLANQLARHGLRALVIERNSGPSVRTKALGVQARTLEIYSWMGIAERAIGLGAQASGANLWVEGRKMARIPLGDMGRDLSPYPYLLILGQDDNERLLGDALHSRGIDVQWNAELVALAQHPDHVTATIQTQDGHRETIRTNWVAGCDGAHSAVRRLNGIGFPGSPYEHVFFVADTLATGSMVSGELNVYLWKRGFHLFFPMRGANHWRVVGIVPSALQGREDLDFKSVIPSIRDAAGPGLGFQDCRWFSTYRIHHRRAERFHHQSCFLLGDAAHIHSPVGAQGMNTGLQDAYNLGWKLALVATGRATVALLDSYSSEREPFADRLVRTTDRAFSLVVSERWWASLLRTRLLARLVAFAMTRDRFRKLAFLTISQIGIHYRGGPLSEPQPGWPKGAPTAGERFPWMRFRFVPGAALEDFFGRLDDTRFNLIVIGQSATAELVRKFADILIVHQVPQDPDNARELARVNIPNPSWYLLRPDGHIGSAGKLLRVEELKRYFSSRVGLR